MSINKFMRLVANSIGKRDSILKMIGDSYLKTRNIIMNNPSINYLGVKHDQKRPLNRITTKFELHSQLRSSKSTSKKKQTAQKYYDKIHNDLTTTKDSLADGNAAIWRSNTASSPPKICTPSISHLLLLIYTTLHLGAKSLIQLTGRPPE